jgi:hypothetical protein
MDPLNLLKNLPFAVESRIAESVNVRFDRHPSSAPFLSGDTYRALADYVMDDEPVTPVPEVKGSGVFFLSSWRLEEFRKEILPKLRSAIVLVTHHGDVNIDQRFWDIAEHPFVLKWFAQNAVNPHPKIEPLPIGLEDQRKHAHGNVKDFVNLRRRKAEKIARIVWGFSLRTNPDERFRCYRSLWGNRVADEIWWPLNSREYRKHISRYMFVASPPGNGVDCHRTWEAMYLRNVPIVPNRYPFADFAGKGVPLHTVEDWSELRSLDEAELQKIYRAHEGEFENPMLYAPYWMNRIRASLSGGARSDPRKDR